MKILDIINQLPRKGQIGIIPKSCIKFICIHHDAIIQKNINYNAVDLYKREAHYHIDVKKRDGLQYHFRIDKKGNIYRTRKVTDLLYHASNLSVNTSSVAVCLDGNFMTENPTQRQLEGLAGLLKHLMGKLKIKKANIKGHQEVALKGYGTACPGKNLMNWLINFRKAEPKPTKKEKAQIKNLIKKFKEYIKSLLGG